MKYHRRDLVLVLASLGQGALLLYWAARASEQSFWMNFAYFWPALFLAYFNPIVVTHNFLHTPFFRSKFLNNLFSILNSMSMGLPTILYKYHHLNHHRHNNSLEDPSSTWLYGKDQRQEHWFKYSALSVFRDGTTQAAKLIVKKKEGGWLALESAATVGFMLLLAWIDWRFFVFWYLPYWLCGWFLAHVENYFEHYQARSPASRFGNAVSIYHTWYNALMFNEGYHQEHHISPQEHWSLRPQTRERFRQQMQEAGAYEASWPPLLGMFE